MKIILQNHYGSGLHPVDFERQLAEYGYTEKDLYPSISQTWDEFIKKWRSNPDLVEIIEKYYRNSNEYKIVEVPDNTDYRITESEGYETAVFAVNNRLYTDKEYVENENYSDFLCSYDSDKEKMHIVKNGVGMSLSKDELREINFIYDKETRYRQDIETVLENCRMPFVIEALGDYALDLSKINLDGYKKKLLDVYAEKCRTNDDYLKCLKQTFKEVDISPYVISKAEKRYYDIDKSVVDEMLLNYDILFPDDNEEYINFEWDAKLKEICPDYWKNITKILNSKEVYYTRVYSELFYKDVKLLATIAFNNGNEIPDYLEVNIPITDNAKAILKDKMDDFFNRFLEEEQKEFDR